MNPSRVAIVLVALVLAAGCRSATSPEPGRTTEPTLVLEPRNAVQPLDPFRSSSYPLALGNRWDYYFGASRVLHPASPEEPTVFTDEEGTNFTDRIVCTESRGGREYFVFRRDYAPAVGDGSHWRVRQDRDGLYELDDAFGPSACENSAPAVSSHPASDRWTRFDAQVAGTRHAAAWRAAAERLARRQAALATLGRDLSGASALAGEIQRLGYPLRVGQHWVIRDSPRFEAHVEGVRTLDRRFAHGRAWVVRITSELFGPDDVVRTYYSGRGYAGLDATLFSDATDAQGNLVGVLESRERELFRGFRPGSPLGGQPSPLAAAN